MSDRSPGRPPLVAVVAVSLCVVLAAGIVGVSDAVEGTDSVENVRSTVFGSDEVDDTALADLDTVQADADRGGLPDENTSTLEVIAADGDRFRYRIVVESGARPAVVDGHSADREDTIRYNGDGTVTIDGATGDGSGDAYVVTGEVRSVQVFGNVSQYRIELDGERVTDDPLPAANGSDAGNGDGDGVDEDDDTPDAGDDGESGPPDGSEAGPPDDGDAGAPDDADPDPPENDTQTPASTTEPPTDTPDQQDGTPEAGEDSDPNQPAETPDDTSDQSGDSPAREIDACTVVDEPGRYELADDLGVDGDGGDSDDGVCLHVRAPDVVLDGNGNSVVGDGSEDSIGLLLLNGTPRSGDVGDPLTNVTVRDVRVTGFDTGVQAGSLDAVGTSFTLVEVNASGNAGSGVYFNEVDDSTLRNVTASDNGIGVHLWETYDIEVRGLAVEDNDAQGLYLAQNVGRSTFSDVRAVGNGDGDDNRAAIRLSTDVVDNRIVDSVVADNGGPGIGFSDSRDNVVRDTTIEDNVAPGVVGDFAGADRLERVTIRGNGDAQLRVKRGELGVTELAVGDALTVSFVDGVADLGFGGDDPFEFDTLERESLPGDPPGTPVAREALSVSGAAVPTELSFELDGTADPDAVDLWRYDGDDWHRVADGTVTDGQFTATVNDGGVLVPLESTLDTEEEGTTETTTGTPEAPEDNETATPATPEDDQTATATATPGTPEETETGTGTPGGDTNETEASGTEEGTETPGADDSETATPETADSETATPETADSETATPETADSETATPEANESETETATP
ncbi:hypothetical protein GRX01_13770 [Halobaculum sp. WSA2]|uniref:Periplasmic copper-binding protein NosD beta helix domain-containing protein n=1 Tax=Halobaculum saliterrae TaxID=2073113 RepID=A0A6B0T192_9EURY|nr:right-handed parallel beta-helix repeat-containing protein [Halobaculum saliterrae]MXR42402.1 hypothetical protein [Halobaculum saliterrae]